MSCPLLFDSIDIEYSFFLTVLYDVTCWCATGKIDQKAHLTHKNFIKHLFVVELSDG